MADTTTEPVSAPVPDPRAEGIWNLVLDELCQQIDAPSSGVWFEGTVPTSFANSTLTLHVPNSFAVEYIETRFGELMRSVVQEQVGPGTEISIQSYSTDSSAFASAQQRAM